MEEDFMLDYIIGKKTYLIECSYTNTMQHCYLYENGKLLFEHMHRVPKDECIENYDFLIEKTIKLAIKDVYDSALVDYKKVCHCDVMYGRLTKVQQDIFENFKMKNNRRYNRLLQLQEIIQEQL